MTLEERVMQDLKEAMKSKNQGALRAIRAIKAAILLHKTDGSGRELDSELEMKLLQKLVKQRKESLEIYVTQGRDDLAQIESEEIEIIEKFLPVQMTEAALEVELKKIIDKTGASTMQDMGKVMGMASKEFAGKADGKTISLLVKKLLGS